MGKLLRSAAVGIAMYSKIPMPQFEWKDEEMRYAICFFPLVGAVIAVLLTGWLYLAGRWGIGLMAETLAACVLPVVVTGGIHVDGFMDTSDALSSWQTKEKRLEILKDSHIGAFAVIMLAVYGALYLAASSEIIRTGGDLRTGILWGMTFVFARTLSGCSVVFFKNAKKEGTLYAFASKAHQKTTRTVMAAEAAAAGLAMLLLAPVKGLACLLAGLAVFGYYRFRSYRDFGGITGDLAGWFLCLAELAMAAVLAVFGLLPV